MEEEEQVAEEQVEEENEQVEEEDEGAQVLDTMTRHEYDALGDVKTYERSECKLTGNKTKDAIQIAWPGIKHGQIFVEWIALDKWERNEHLVQKRQKGMAVEVKKEEKRGRPKGSGKAKVIDDVKPKRGRPKGSGKAKVIDDDVKPKKGRPKGGGKAKMDDSSRSAKKMKFATTEDAYMNKINAITKAHEQGVINKELFDRMMINL